GPVGREGDRFNLGASSAPVWECSPTHENAPRLSPGALCMIRAFGLLIRTRYSYHTMPRKISVLPNVVEHWVITSGLGPVPARKASTAAHGVALRESVHTA